MQFFYLNKIKEKNNLIFKLNIFGIKFSMNFYRDSGLFDKILRPIRFVIFKLKYNKYINRKDKKLIKRLIITNGNLNLINSLAMINQFKLDKNSKNDIVVWSHVSNPEFEKIMKKISNFTPINNYHSFYECRVKDFINYFIKHFFCEYDEIYFTNIVGFIEVVEKLFPKSKYFITEEGVCGLSKPKIFKEVENYIYTKYINKIDFISDPGGGKINSDIGKIINLKKEEFLKISKKCEELFPFDIKLNPEEKNVIFCGTYCGLKYLSMDNIIDAQNSIIEKLIHKGYKVIFKPHPRDNYNYQENSKFQLLKTKIPLECYNLKNKCLAVISLFSSISCQMYHYQNIVGFCATDLIKNAQNDIGINIIKEYTPNVNNLLNIDVGTKTFEELKEEILNLYLNFIKDKPLLSENKVIEKLYEN